MFKYTVYKNADNKKFKEVCENIKKSIPNLKVDEPLIDVDGSVIQKYTNAEGCINVYNDYEVDAVYIDSEINLEGLL